MTRGIGPTPISVRAGGLSEGRAYSASIEIFDIVGAEKGEVSPEVPFTMAPSESAAPKIASGLINVNAQCEKSHYKGKCSAMILRSII